MNNFEHTIHCDEDEEDEDGCEISADDDFDGGIETNDDEDDGRDIIRDEVGLIGGWDWELNPCSHVSHVLFVSETIELIHCR